jgi:DNA-binding MarR family transcriptional regulator
MSKSNSQKASLAIPTARTLPPLPCLCASLRRAARVLTQAYEEELRPQRLRSTQFTVLQALQLTGEVTQGQLAEILAMDSTSLTRTLRTMNGRRWIAVRPGKDRRERLVASSKAGFRKFKQATPAWKRAQANARARLGRNRWTKLMALTAEIAGVKRI